jgi:hypothetical protein
VITLSLEQTAQDVGRAAGFASQDRPDA